MKKVVPSQSLLTVYERSVGRRQVMERRGDISEKTVDAIYDNVKKDRICMDRGDTSSESGNNVLLEGSAREMRACEKVSVIL